MPQHDDRVESLPVGGSIIRKRQCRTCICRSYWRSHAVFVQYCCGVFARRACAAHCPHEDHGQSRSPLAPSPSSGAGGHVHGWIGSSITILLLTRRMRYRNICWCRARSRHRCARRLHWRGRTLLAHFIYPLYVVGSAHGSRHPIGCSSSGIGRVAIGEHGSHCSRPVRRRPISMRVLRHRVALHGAARATASTTTANLRAKSQLCRRMPHMFGAAIAARHTATSTARGTPRSRVHNTSRV